MAMPKNYTDADFPVGTSNPDPVEIMVANFEAEIERLRNRICELERDVERAEYEYLDAP